MTTAPQRAATDPADAAAVNPCALCAPLGASLAFKGIAGAMTLLHGSQGCATYIRRYLISHFREPVDIASSSFTEDTVVFGGASNLKEALRNVLQQYHPAVIGVATTCLAETIGDDPSIPIREFLASVAPDDCPQIITVSTPSYRDAHAAGFTAVVSAALRELCVAGASGNPLAVIPGLVSPADIRYLREISAAFGISTTIFPDFADTLDGPTWQKYASLPPGGTTVAHIAGVAGARQVFDWTAPVGGPDDGAGFLHDKFGTPVIRSAPPIGVRATDQFLDGVAAIAGVPLPRLLADERGRLLDAYVDGHKYVAKKRVVLFGDEPLVAALAGFLCEIGMLPVLCATGSSNTAFEPAIRQMTRNNPEIRVMHRTDTDAIGTAAREMKADLVVGSSKGERLAAGLGVPLVRVGFPIHDRFGAARQLHIGYRGTQELLDRIINALIGWQQDHDGNSYAYY